MGSKKEGVGGEKSPLFWSVGDQVKNKILKVGGV